MEKVRLAIQYNDSEVIRFFERTLVPLHMFKKLYFVVLSVLCFLFAFYDYITYSDDFTSSVFLFLAMLGNTIFISYNIKYKVKSHLQRMPQEIKTVSYEIDVDGIRMMSGAYEEYIQWEDITKAKEFRIGLIFFGSKFPALLPKRCFKDDLNTYQFLQKKIKHLQAQDPLKGNLHPEHNRVYDFVIQLAIFVGIIGIRYI